jgi:hypothetical protein
VYSSLTSPQPAPSEREIVDFITRTSHYGSFTMGGTGCNTNPPRQIVHELLAEHHTRLAAWTTNTGGKLAVSAAWSSG